MILVKDDFAGALSPWVKAIFGALVNEKGLIWLCQETANKVSESERVCDYAPYI